MLNDSLEILEVIARSLRFFALRLIAIANTRPRSRAQMSRVNWTSCKLCSFNLPIRKADLTESGGDDVIIMFLS